MSAAPLLAAARQLRRPTLFVPLQDPVEFVSLTDLHERLQELGQGRPLTYRAGRAWFPDLDDFPSITAYVNGDYLATIGSRWDEYAQRGALEALSSGAMRRAA